MTTILISKTIACHAEKIIEEVSTCFQIIIYEVIETLVSNLPTKPISCQSRLKAL